MSLCEKISAANQKKLLVIGDFRSHTHTDNLTFRMDTTAAVTYWLSRFSFLDLYKKYHAEVYPAHLVFVSFLPDQHAPGRMVTELRQAGFSPIQFKFNAHKPDLTKLDKLFGLLSSKTGTFEDQLTDIESRIRNDGLTSLIAANKAKTQ